MTSKDSVVADAPHDDSQDRPLTRRKKQGLKSKDVICEATIYCLDKYGYAATSTSRITEKAGVSRGALTHHFRSKEDLIVETTNRILRPTIRKPAPTNSHSHGDDELSVIKLELRRVWQQLANTAEARALLEILVAFRTDIKLRNRIKSDLVLWNTRMQQSFLQSYTASDGDDERLNRAWQVARVFYRGLITHDAFVNEPGELDEIMEEFVNMLAPMMQRRQLEE